MSDVFILGPGKVFAVPPSDATDPSPFEFLETSEVSIEVKQDTKDAFGGQKDPLITALLRRQISGTLKQPFIQGSAIARISNGVLTSGGKTGYLDEDTGVIASATYTVAHPTGFELLCCKDENGDPMTKVATVTAAGQYSVTSGGVFTFHSSANGKHYYISYAGTVATGYTLAINTEQMGLAPQFKLAGYGSTVDAKAFGWEFNAVTFPDWSLPFKAEDFVAPDLKFKVFRKTGLTNIGNLYLPTR